MYINKSCVILFHSHCCSLVRRTHIKMSSFNELNRWVYRSLILSTAVLATVSEQGTRSYFPCFTDICNVHDQDQFCSDRERKCRDCLEIIDSCFEPELPSNCTRTCVEFYTTKQLNEFKESPCEGFGPIKNGRSNGSSSGNYRQGDVISVICDAGFRVSSHNTVECKAFGQWSHDFPTCEEITCPMLPPVLNGRHNGSLTLPHKAGDVLTVQCFSGYQRIGPQSTMCNRNGTWENQLSICQKYPEVPLIKNGKLYRQKIGQATDAVQAVCDEGYTLQGSDTFRWAAAQNLGRINEYLPNCLKEEGLNVWMLVAIIEGVILIGYVCYRIYKACIRGKKNERHKYERTKDTKRDKEDGSEDKITLISETEDKNETKSNRERAFESKDVSLHEQKMQREGTLVSNSVEYQVPEVSSNPFSTNVAYRSPIDQPDIPYQSNSILSKVTESLIRNQDVSADDVAATDAATTAGEKDAHSSMSREPTVKKSESGNHVNLHININSNNSADNSNQVVVGSGADPKSNCNRSPETPPKTKDLQMNDLKNENLKSPIEESATFQPSHPETLSDSNTASAGVTYMQELKGGAHANECSQSLRVNGLAVQQDVNNEQDTGRKLAMPCFNLNADDIQK